MATIQVLFRKLLADPVCGFDIQPLCKTLEHLIWTLFVPISLLCFLVAGNGQLNSKLFFSSPKWPGMFTKTFSFFLKGSL